MKQPATDRPAIEPLDTFYREAGRPLPAVRLVVGSDMPEPYRRLLVHETDMTRTLESFHGSAIHLVVHSRQLRGPELWREVVLTLDRGAQPVEFGAIRIWVDRFPPSCREEILAGRRPLGGILNSTGLRYVSRPLAFFEFEPDPFLRAVLQVQGHIPLFGRCNALRSESGEVLAEIVEILPPAA
jgi:chorismate-pyruvate lyase